MSEKQTGRIIKASRIMAGNGLRGFADAIGIQPSRMSDIEVGNPATEAELESIAKEIERTWQDGIAWRERIVDERDRLTAQLAAETKRADEAERERDEARAQHDAFRCKVDEQDKRIEEKLNRALSGVRSLDERLAAAEARAKGLEEGIARVRDSCNTRSGANWNSFGVEFAEVADELNALLAAGEEAKDASL